MVHKKSQTMKPLFTFIIFTLFFSNAFAQNTFAPPGSEWYHNMTYAPYGVFHSYYAGDTIIQGIPCRIVKQDAHEYQSWIDQYLVIGNNPDLYIYNNTDTVFVFNIPFGKFTPLYIFNVVAGDTITLPITGNYIINADSFFTFVVDSVNTTTYDTAHLKTVYEHVITSNYEIAYSGAYAEKIGGVNSLWLNGAVVLLTDDTESENGLRCYSDPSTSIKMVQGNCDIYNESVTTVEAGDLKVYPNPATDEININWGTPFTGNIQLFSATGQILYTRTITAKQSMSIDVSKIPNGIYLLSTTQNGVTTTKRVTVLH